MLSRLVQTNSTSLSVFLPVLSHSLAQVEGANLTGSQRSRVDLNGDWERHVNGALFDLSSAIFATTPRLLSFETEFSVAQALTSPTGYPPL